MSDPVDAELRVCPECGEAIKVQAMKCRFCGAFFDLEAQREQRRVPRPRRKADTSTGLIFLGVVVTLVTLVLVQDLWFALPVGPMLVIAGVVAHFREQRRDREDAEV